MRFEVSDTSPPLDRFHHVIEVSIGQWIVPAIHKEAVTALRLAVKKAYDDFKKKFLAQMANMMIRRIKHENERMLKALRKMREQD